MLKTRRSSSAPSGQSHDHYRDLLQRHPDAIHPLTSLCSLVAGDNLTDGPERMALVTGKGTVLLKAVALRSRCGTMSVIS